MSRYSSGLISIRVDRCSDMIPINWISVVGNLVVISLGGNRF